MTIRIRELVIKAEIEESTKEEKPSERISDAKEEQKSRIDKFSENKDKQRRER